MAHFQYLSVNGVRLGYLDFGGPGRPLLALHGLFGRATMFVELAEALQPEWRVVALDQRGHGWSDHPDDYSREAYINDAATAVRELGLAPAVIYGHSLGGVNAYQLAARHADLVRALIIEDVGAVIDDDIRWTLEWPRRFPSLLAMREYLGRTGMKGDAYFTESAIEYADGWGFRFTTEELVRSQESLNGDHWQDWLGSSCPALLMHGGRSWVISPEHAREMAERRPRTERIEFPRLKHSIYQGDLKGLLKAVRAFLLRLEA